MRSRPKTLKKPSARWTKRCVARLTKPIRKVHPGFIYPGDPNWIGTGSSAITDYATFTANGGSSVTLTTDFLAHETVIESLDEGVTWHDAATLSPAMNRDGQLVLNTTIMGPAPEHMRPGSGVYRFTITSRRATEAEASVWMTERLGARGDARLGIHDAGVVEGRVADLLDLVSLAPEPEGDPGLRVEDRGELTDYADRHEVGERLDGRHGDAPDGAGAAGESLSLLIGVDQPRSDRDRRGRSPSRFSRKLRPQEEEADEPVADRRLLDPREVYGVADRASGVRVPHLAASRDTTFRDSPLESVLKLEWARKIQSEGFAS